MRLPCSSVTGVAVPTDLVRKTETGPESRIWACDRGEDGYADFFHCGALDLARQADGSVTVLHVIEWLAEEEPRSHAHFNVPEYRQHLIDDARQRVQALVADEPQTWSAIRM